MRQEIHKILICTTKRKSNGVIGGGHSSWDTGDLTIVAEVNNLNEAEDFKDIENYIVIPIYRFLAEK